MLWLIRYAIFGLVAGVIARLLHPGKDPMNWFWTMLLGVGGSIVGGWVGHTMGMNTDATLVGWICAIAGSVLLLFIYHLVTNPRIRGTTGTTGTTTDYSRGTFDPTQRP